MQPAAKGNKDNTLHISTGSHRDSSMDRRIERSWWQRYRLVITASVMLLVVAAGVAAFWPERGRTYVVDNARIAVSAVSSGQFDDFIPVRGQVKPIRTIFLDAVEGGRVEKIDTEDGAYVNEGELLVELSNTTLQLDVISREAQVTEQLNALRTLELDLERNRLQHQRDLIEIDYQLQRLNRLVERRRRQAEQGNIPRADLEDTEDELAYFQKRRGVTLASQETDMRLQNAQMQQLRTAATQLQASLEFARRNLEGLKVRAPVSGKLTALNADVGQSLARGERLGQIDVPDGFKLSTQIDEFYLNRVDLEQTAEVDIDDRRYLLQVAKIYPQVSNGRFQADLVFAGEIPTRIRRGQTFQLRLFLGDASEATLIPNGAFFQDTGGKWLFVVSIDGRQALRRNVQLGRRNTRFIEVLDGLEPGEQVITSPYTSFIDMQRLLLNDK